MFQIFFVIICLFLIFCQYVFSTPDSNVVSEREHIRNVNSHSVVQHELDNVVLSYYPGKDGYINVLYHTKNTDNHEVYKVTFWYQTISIKQAELNTFAQSFNSHIRECCCCCPKRESVNISRYGFCTQDCKMSSFESKFLREGMERYGRDTLLKAGMKRIKKTFFNKDCNIDRHRRQTKWEDFFSVIGAKFLDSSGEQIYSEEFNPDHQFTYLYLLTDRFMYELGYNLNNKSLFLLRVDLMVLALHSKFEGICCNNNVKHIFEMPFDMIFDSQNEKSQESTMQYKNVEGIKESNQHYSENDIKRDTRQSMLPNQKVKSRTKSTRNIFHSLNKRREELGMRGVNSSLKSKYTENEFVINKRTKFEKNLWKDIMNVYENGCSGWNVDIKYYENTMPLK